jgi:predicted enzyme related to lactoylglutathione lyase
MANVKALAFVVYPVADLERGKAFYRDTVGLGEPRMLHDAWAEFDLGGSTFALASGGEALGITPGSAFSAAFEVDDLDAAVERLRSHGAAILNEYDGPTCRAAFARDSEGNGFSLHRLKA